MESWCPPTADQSYLPLGKLVVEHVVHLTHPVAPVKTDYWQVTLQTERSLAAMEEHCRQCASEIDAAGFDVLFANSCKFFRTPAIARLSQTPAILYLQEPYRWLYEALPRLCWLAPDRRPGRWWTRRNLRAAFADLRELRNKRVQAREEVANAAAFKRILVNSYFSRESVLRAYGLDSTVCYLGIDPVSFRISDAEREDIVVGLGSITPEKGIKLCIEAMARLASPGATLIWVGNIALSAYLDELTDLSRKLGVRFEPRVNVSDAELKAILGRSSVMVYAPRLEPFGLAPLEANACGVPVVAVAEGGIRETVVDMVNGLLVDANPEAIAAGIDRLRSDTVLARTLGRNGRAMVEQKWSASSAAARLEVELKRYARSGTERQGNC